MKINGLGSVIPFTGATRARRGEGDGGSARQQYDPEQNRRDDESKGEPAEPFDPKQIDDAVQSFATDVSAQAHGLSATVQGTGPGLRIQVKDSQGVLLRQFSGEEFLKLRETTSQSPVKRGKLLDQKL